MELWTWHLSCKNQGRTVVTWNTVKSKILVLSGSGHWQCLATCRWATTRWSQWQERFQSSEWESNDGVRDMSMIMQIFVARYRELELNRTCCQDAAEEPCVTRGQPVSQTTHVFLIWNSRQMNPLPEMASVAQTHVFSPLCFLGKKWPVFSFTFGWMLMYSRTEKQRVERPFTDLSSPKFVYVVSS